MNRGSDGSDDGFCGPDSVVNEKSITVLLLLLLLLFLVVVLVLAIDMEALGAPQPKGTYPRWLWDLIPRVHGRSVFLGEPLGGGNLS